MAISYFIKYTYNWPYEEQGVGRQRPTVSKVWPWDLLMLIAKASLMGSCRHFRAKGTVLSEEVILMRGMRAVCPAWLPVTILAMMTLDWSDLTMSLVPVMSPCSFWIKSMGAPILSSSRCGGRPDGCSWFKLSSAIVLKRMSPAVGSSWSRLRYTDACSKEKSLGWSTSDLYRHMWEVRLWCQ